MGDLIVDDQYVKEVGEYSQMCSKKLQTVIDQYINILNRIKNEAVASGSFQEAIDNFSQYASSLNDVVLSMGNEINDICIQYVTEIDEKDDYLY